VSAVFDLASRIGVSSLLGGVSFSWAAFDWLGLGAGVAVAHVGATGWEEYAAAQAIVVPLQAEVHFGGAGKAAASRRGFSIGLLVAPGVGVLSGRGLRSSARPGSVGGALVVGLTVGYAFW
jgi:hypothetical protein